MAWTSGARFLPALVVCAGTCASIAFGPRLAAQATVADGRQSHAVVTHSPDGRSAISIGTQASSDGRFGLVYSITRRGVPVVAHARLGLAFAGGSTLGDDVRVSGVARSAHDAVVRGLIGKASSARDDYRETTVALTERGIPHRRLDLVVRVYDDGVALRYRIPSQPGLQSFALAGERTHVVVDGASQAYVLTRSGYSSSYEGYYKILPLRDVPADTLLALPVLLHHPGGTWMAVTEASLTDYAGMYLSRAAGAGGDLVSRLSPMPDDPSVAVRGRTPFETPWRVFMLADDPAQLIASNLITVLNPPSAIGDVGWIHPGKTTFPWWNDYVMPDTGFKSGLNTATAKYYIDFCAAHGIPYHTLDGYQDLAWYGGHIEPRDSVMPDVTRGNPDLDLPEVLRYAKAKGVHIRVWMHWKALRPQLDTALARYERMGVEGIMVDFMDRDDQEMLAWLHEVVSKAAAHHLTVVFHGASKPTGMSRTWPNLLTVEAVMGLEYDKFGDENTVTPTHELLVPFVRMVAGPLDFHQGGFRYSTREAYRSEYTNPRVIGTRARSLALYVVYEDPLPMMADSPSAYERQTGLDFVVATPTTWDETRVLGGTIGERLTVARRKGTAWYVGTMTSEQARTVAIPLRFLGAGTFVAEIYADSLGAVPDARHARVRVTAADVVQARLAPSGGHVMRIVRARPEDADLPRYDAAW